MLDIEKCWHTHKNYDIVILPETEPILQSNLMSTKTYKSKTFYFSSPEPDTSTASLLAVQTSLRLMILFSASAYALGLRGQFKR